jgi:carbonic anhydrase
MKKLLTVLVSVFTAFQVGSSANATNIQNLSANQALAKLKSGNANFVKMKLTHPNSTLARRSDLLRAQHPFAVVVGCSDSRVPTEMIFDQGLGDIFVIRNAGNIMDLSVMGSVEYAVRHLGVNLVVVMGHQFCGAVGAAMSTASDVDSIEAIKKSIQPAIEKCRQDDNLTYENAIKANARMTANSILTKDPAFSEYMKEHNVLVIPAYYNLDTGKVDFLTLQ